MAPISKFLSFLFLTILSFSLQIHARDSQFFSKVSHVNNNNNVREVPNNETPLSKPEQQPVFIPETENSYGLYGHDSGLHPPTTTITNNVDPNTYQSYEKTSSQDQTNNKNVNSYFNYQKDSYSTKYPNEVSDTKLTGTSYTNNNNNNYDNNKYSSSSNEFSNTKFPEEGYNSMENQNNNNNKYFYNNNKDASNELSNTKFTEEGYNSMENQNNNNNNDYFYNNNKDVSNELSNKKFPEEGYNSMQNQNNNNNNNKYYYNNKVAANDFKSNAASNNNYNNGERQGMSDTRVMEGGKYFYDVNSEEKYNPTFNGDSSKGVVNSENWYNKKGYFGNNNVNNYENNKNSMGGYQNQEQFEDDQEEFEP